MKLIVERSSAPDNPRVCRLTRQAERPSLKQPANGQIPRLVLDSLSHLKSDNYLFGGAMRDFMVGMPPRDYDFVARVHQGSLRTAGGTRLGNMKDAVEFNPGRYQVHVAPFAEEMTVAEELTEGRCGSITMDVMALDLESGEMIDPCRGLGDFRAGVVRVTDDRELRENPQLAFRAFRLAAKYGVGVELTTLETIQDSLERYRDVVLGMKERWRIVRMVAQGLGNGHPSQNLEWWKVSGIMKVVLPEIDALAEADEKRFEQALFALENRSLSARLPNLLSFLDEEDRAAVVSRFKNYLNGRHRIEGKDLRVIASLTTA